MVNEDVFSDTISRYLSTLPMSYVKEVDKLSAIVIGNLESQRVIRLRRMPGEDGA